MALKIKREITPIFNGFENQNFDMFEEVVLVSLTVTSFREKNAYFHYIDAFVVLCPTRSKTLERTLMWTVELHFYLLTYQDRLRVQYILSNLLTF